MVRDISSSDSESESETSSRSSSLGLSNITTYSGFTSDENERSDKSEADDDSQNWSEYCQCSTVYTGELDERYCPHCSKLVPGDAEDNSSIDWDMISRHFTVTKTSSASLENLINAKFFSGQNEEVLVDDESSIGENESDPDDQLDAGLYEDTYPADSEDNAE